MKTIIYGIGKGYFNFFNNKDFISDGILKQGIDVVGFSDSNESVWGKEILYNNKKFLVQNIDEFQNVRIDKIIVTTKIYFNEVKESLIRKNYKESDIFLIDQLYEMYLNDTLLTERFEYKQGIEIGGPTELFRNIYKKCEKCDNVDFSMTTVWEKNKTEKFSYGGKVLGKNWIAEATDMCQIENEKYDFLLSSNNLEHIANPLKALKEFSRIVKKGGSILVLVPMKETCFDHNREYTKYKHLLDDYMNNVQEDDLSHLEEIINKHDYDMDIACGGKEKFIKRAMKNIENRCLHHHVFDEECLKRSFDFVGLKVISVSKLSNNLLVIGEKRGNIG